MRGRTVLVVTVLGLTVTLLLLPVMSRAGGSTEVPPPTPSGVPTITTALPVIAPDSFYAAGGPTSAGPPGEVLARLELRAPAGARKWAVIYRSTGMDGSPVGVSGLMVASADPIAADARPRTVLAVAHATTGLADQCAPSRQSSDGLVTTVLPLLDQGFMLAVTDYEGLGTPGPHPYIVGVSEGHSVLDAARAASTMPDTGAGPATLLIGGSQGGHAVLWAADMAANAAPELDVLGAVAFAPAGDLEAIAGFDRSAAAGSDAWSAAVTLIAAWHRVYGLGLNVLTPAARALVPELDTACSVAIDRQPTVVDLRTLPAWQERLRENTPGATRTSVPELIFQGDADQVVPIESTRSMVARLCAIGDAVDLRVVPGADHRGSLTPGSLLAALGWVSDRLAGVPAASNCGG